jgi:S-layer homology domain
VAWQTWPPGTPDLVWNTAAHAGQPAPAHSGTWMANLGGGNDQSFQLYQTVTFTENTYMSVWYWIDSQESFCGRDSGTIWVNSHVVQIFTLCTSWNTGGWIQAVYDISPYVSPGQTGDILFDISTDRTSPSRWLIDDVTFHKTFADVSNIDPFAPYIEALYQAGITGGCSINPSQYCPDAPVTRGQMAIFLERGIHSSSYSPPAVGDSTGFTDVSTLYWASAWIKQLAAEGITGGCGSSIYCPEASVTRAQMAVFLLRSKYGPSYNPPAVGASTGFGDVQSTYWAGAWIKQLVAEGITAGCGNGNYCPEAPVTRAQMAVFLVRTFSLP